MPNDLLVSIGAGIGGFIAIFFIFKYYTKFERWLKEL